MLNKNFKDMLNALNDSGVEYLLVGAHAIAFYAAPRATGDIDIWVRPTRENAARVWDALARFGAPRRKLKLDDLCTADNVYQIGVAPNRIDILTSISGVEFEAAWASKTPSQLDGVPVNIIGRNELLQNKRASGRPKDLADIASLEHRDHLKGGSN